MVHFNLLLVRTWRYRLNPFDRERGASLVEYSLLVALIAMVCFGAVSFLGEETAPVYSQLGASLN